MGAIERVKKAIQEIQKGNMIVMIDDEDRENEGDLVYAGVFSTPQKVNFLAKEARGLICVALTKDIANRLQLNPMVHNNDSSYETAFTISVDAKNATTGISAYERDETIKILSNPTSTPQELVRPGHIFPLIAKDGGVLVRTGHTEGSVDICKLAGVMPSAVICEIMKDDGTMARRADLDQFASKHNLPIVYISDIVEYRLQYESLVVREAVEEIELFGVKFKKITYKDHLNNTHYAITNQASSTTNVKFYPIEDNVSCIAKLDEYLKVIEYIKYNSGAIIFINNPSHDKQKEFGIGAQILKDLNICKLHLLSHGNSEFLALKGFGLEIVDRVKI
ncbi:MAG: bifunctional 3,4-dihydroxy-2-butanone 4-phosphate synthase/GTP cyclohydrolase II [Epsilonproteobacteria bacterium]|nr:bifunctional 3,4-dihydroxy-2-butanone 4-phosphate synthase/GTP cyclohydrolase II [Campylobacterota bacterium]